MAVEQSIPGIEDSASQQARLTADLGPSLRVTEPETLLRMAVRYWIHGADVVGRILPDEMQTSPLMMGLSVEHQASIFVETTPGFEEAKVLVWIAFKNGRYVEDQPHRLRAFVGNLAARLPHGFERPRPEMSGEELERMEAAADAARQAEIDAKHIRRAPGMAKIFRGFNADWNEFG